MRTFLMLTAAASLQLAVAGGAFAQNASGSTQTPASPNAASQTVGTTNSLPPGAVAMPTERPGSDLGTTATGPAQPRLAAPAPARAP